MAPQVRPFFNVCVVPVRKHFERNSKEFESKPIESEPVVILGFRAVGPAVGWTLFSKSISRCVLPSVGLAGWLSVGQVAGRVHGPAVGLAFGRAGGYLISRLPLGRTTLCSRRARSIVKHYNKH